MRFFTALALGLFVLATTSILSTTTIVGQRYPHRDSRVGLPAEWNSDIFFVTSVTSVFLRRAAQRTPIFDNTLWRRPLNAPLLVYHENSWESDHGRQPIRLDEFPSHGRSVPAWLSMMDVFNRQPWLFALQSSDPTSPLERWYAFANHSEPFEPIMKFKSAKLLVRRLASLLDALETVPEGVQVIWVDVDVVAENPLDEEWRRQTAPFDIVYIPFQPYTDWVQSKPALTSDWMVESGVMAIRNNERMRAFFRDAVDAYRVPFLLEMKMACSQPSPVRPAYCEHRWVVDNLWGNDIYVISYLLKAAHLGVQLPSRQNSTQLPLRQGWFAVGCGQRCTPGCPSNPAGIDTQYPFTPVVCVGHTEFTMKFHLAYYLNHRMLKGAFSDMRAQSNASRFDPELYFQ